MKTIYNTKNERLKNFHKLFNKLNFALFYFVIYILDNYFVRYIFLSGCIYFGTFNGGKSSFENYFIQTQDMKFRIRGNALYIFQFVS